MSRPKNISDLNIIWAIRDIPKSILNLKLKGVLCMLVSIIGNSDSEYYYHSQFDLSKKFGCSIRSVPGYMNYLEEIGFISIKRPFHYTDGDSNEYKLNYEFILETASKFHAQTPYSKTCR